MINRTLKTDNKDIVDTVHTNRSDAKDQLLEMDVKDGMLMHHDFHGKTLQEVDQLIVPESLRCNILHLAHDIPASSHLGTAKTKERL